MDAPFGKWYLLIALGALNWVKLSKKVFLEQVTNACTLQGKEEKTFLGWIVLQ